MHAPIISITISIVKLLNYVTKYIPNPFPT